MRICFAFCVCNLHNILLLIIAQKPFEKLQDVNYSSDISIRAVYSTLFFAKHITIASEKPIIDKTPYFC